MGRNGISSGCPAFLSLSCPHVSRAEKPGAGVTVPGSPWFSPGFQSGRAQEFGAVVAIRFATVPVCPRPPFCPGSRPSTRIQRDYNDVKVLAPTRASRSSPAGDLRTLQIEMNPDEARKLSSDERRLLLDQLGSEYRILQDKIDKIAGFRFTIRGWSVTLVIASSIGAATAKISSAWVLYGLIPFILAFLLMERAQLRHRRTFGGRVVDIEKRISKLLNEAVGGQLVRPDNRQSAENCS
jgi:hypothetical protein